MLCWMCADAGLRCWEKKDGGDSGVDVDGSSGAGDGAGGRLWQRAMKVGTVGTVSTVGTGGVMMTTYDC